MITKLLLASESWESCIPRRTQELRLPPAGFVSVAQTSGTESALIRFVATASSILQFPSWTMILKEFPFPFLCEKKESPIRRCLLRWWRAATSSCAKRLECHSASLSQARAMVARAYGDLWYVRKRAGFNWHFKHRRPRSWWNPRTWSIWRCALGGAQGDAWGVGHGCTHHPGHAVKTCVWQNLLPYLSLLRPLVSDITSCCALTSCRCSFDTWDPIKNHWPKIWMVKWLWNYEHDIPWLLKTTKIAKLCVCMKTPFLSHSHRAHLIRPAFRTWLVEAPSWRLCWCLASGKRTPTPSSSRPRIQRLGYGVGANMCQLWSDQAQAKLCKTGIVLYWRKFAWWSMCTNLLRNGLGIALRNCQRIHYLWPLNHEHVIVHVRSALDVFI